MDIRMIVFLPANNIASGGRRYKKSMLAGISNVFVRVVIYFPNTKTIKALARNTFTATS
jgi:ParB-like chromosome segregation protein Spo0J